MGKRQGIIRQKSLSVKTLGHERVMLEHLKRIFWLKNRVFSHIVFYVIFKINSPGRKGVFLLNPFFKYNNSGRDLNVINSFNDNGEV